MRLVTPAISVRRRAAVVVRSNAAFTLTEILIATSILGMAMAMTMIVFVAALKRAYHTEDALQGTAELRMASDLISQTVRSTASLPTVQSSGTELLFAPKEMPVLQVVGGPPLSPPVSTATNAWRSNQRTLRLRPTAAPALSPLFAGTARPSGVVATTEMTTYFRTVAPSVDPDLNVKVSDLLLVGDSIAISGSVLGPPITRTLNSVANNTGDTTITCTTNLGFDVPDGTLVRGTVARGPRSMFRVATAASGTIKVGDLVYFPDTRTMSRFTILAHNITATPLTDPSNSSSAATVPFTIPTSATNYVIINLQRMPRGLSSGRTLQGIQTTVFMRTNPLAP